MKNKKTFFLWGLIFFLALFVRLFRLGEIPYGFHVDEVKAGWNAYSILKTGMDDKGNILPLYYDSFGDFRPTGMFYAIIPSLLLFGRNVFAVRFPFALIGSLTMFPIIFILRELDKKNNRREMMASIFLALNPWHIVVSRATSESVISIFLTLWGIYFLLKTFRQKNWLSFLWSVLFFVLSYFFYHSIRVLAPIFVLVIILIKKFQSDGRQNYFQPTLIFLVLLGSTLLFLSGKEARGRMSQVSLKSDFKVLYEVTKMPIEEGPGHVFRARVFHNRIASYLRRFMEEYKEYFGTSFLLGDVAKPVRYTTSYVGLLTYFEFLLFVLGLFWVSKKKEMLIILALLVVAPLPAAVTIEDTPNLQRAIYMIPFLIMVMVYGLYRLPRWIFLLIGLGYLVNFIYFWHMYFIHQKMSIASYYRNGGNTELTKRLADIKKDYKKIVLTNSPDDLYPWIAFGGNYEPESFNRPFEEERKIENFIFSGSKCPSSSALEKNTGEWNGTLFVDAEGCVIEEKYKSIVMVETIETIYRPDGSPPYYLRTIELLTKASD